MKKTLVFSLLASVGLLAYTSIDTIDFIIPKNWPQPVYAFNKNPLSASKIEIGRALFYDPILSRDSTIACSNCHSQYAGFTHIDHPLSHGVENRIGKRNSSSLINLAWSNSFMWDGAINHLDMQALAPMTNHDEMDENIQHVISKLQTSPIYPKLFYKAYKDSNIKSEYVLKSLSQFVLTLVSCNAKYDSVMRHEASFTSQEANGYQLFQQHCGSCHKEPLFTNNQYENNGLPVDTSLNDLGRMSVTHDPRDSIRFKVPTLRNIEYSYPYMHDGRFNRLSQVLKHYTEGIQPSKTLSKPLLKPIPLSSNERVDVIAFLLTLSDKSFVYNPAFSYPKNTLIR